MTTTGREKRGARDLAVTGIAAGLMALGIAGCKSKNTAAPIVGPDGQDPAAANMAQPYTGGDAGGYAGGSSTVVNSAAGSRAAKVRVLGSQEAYPEQASGQEYSQAYGEPNSTPIIRQAPAYEPAYDPNVTQGAYDQGYNDAEEAGEQALAESDQAPPPLPEYDQPPAPDPNYLWTPGYYDYASAGYYWVPGAWVAPPFYGALWTPPWWGFNSGHYLFHRGYWGPHVGFYGGINYGFGYVGTGYYGGFWRGHDFFYNRAVTNVNTNNVHNVYNRTVVINNRTFGPRPGDRVDFNGGRGGIQAQPNASDMAALHEAHYAPVAAQRQNRIAAADNRGQFVRADGGHPAVAFAGRPIGNTANIASVPREQPFNHPNLPGVSGRPEAGTAFRNGREAVEGTHIVSGRGPDTAGRVQQQGPGMQLAGENRGLAGAPQRSTETGRALAAAPAGQAGFAGRQGTLNDAIRPGSGNGQEALVVPGGRLADGRVANGRFQGQVQPLAVPRSRDNNARTPLLQSVPAARTNTEPQRQPEAMQRSLPAERRGEPFQRQVEPAQRMSPAERGGAPFQRQAEPMQRSLPAERQGESLQRPNAPAFRSEAAPAVRPEPAPMQRAEPAAVPHPAPSAAPRAGGGGEREHAGHH